MAHALAHLSAFWFEVQPGITISVWYPPAGLALAFLVLRGPRAAGWVFGANFLLACLTPTPRLDWEAVFYPAMITGCYAATAWWVRSRVGPRLMPGGRRETAVFCAAVGLAPLAPALIGTTVAAAAAGAEGWALTAGEFWRSVFAWWVGAACGALVVVPAAMVFVGPWLEGRSWSLGGWRRRPEDLAMALLRMAVLLVTLTVVLAVPALREHSAFYLCFLPLIWIGLRHGMRGTTLATLAVMITGLVGMRLAGTTRDFSQMFLLFEVAVAVVGLGLGTLVARRDQAERELAESRARLDRVIEGAKLGVWEWDVRRRRLESNARLPGMLGYTPEVLAPLEKGLPALMHEGDLAVASAAWRDHLEGRRELFEAKVRMRHRDGHWRWVESRGSIMTRDAEGRPLVMSGTQADITARKQAEAEVARLSRIVEVSPDFILTLDGDGRVLYANRALLAFLGRSEAALAERPPVERWVPAALAERWRREAMPAARVAGAWQGEGSLPDAEGREVPTSQVAVARHEADADGHTFSFILRDISDQKRAEAERRERDLELLQLQKAESLAVLAGGIAHDFNNLLTAIVGHTNLARAQLRADAAARGHLDKVEQAAGRAARLCQQMLAYAGRNPVAFAELDLGRLVREVWGLVESSVSAKVRVRIEEEGPLAPVLAAETQMQQVVMNLLINAAEAIGEGEGEVVVRLRSARLDEAAIAELFPECAVSVGEHTLLEVRDSGAGMTAEVRARIFEPFFTTKFTGQGLGLAAVAGVVKSHRGHIVVRSEPGEGALFRLAFPAVGGDGGRGASAEAGADRAGGAAAGGGLVLLVDDDPMIREVGAGVLQAMGYTPLTAEDGAEGVARFGERAAQLKAVLLDLTMPRMDGFEAHAAMHGIDPRVPVILMSGFSSKLENLPPSAIHPAGVLAKPFNMVQLRERLDAVLKN